MSKEKPPFYRTNGLSDREKNTDGETYFPVRFFLYHTLFTTNFFVTVPRFQNFNCQPSCSMLRRHRLLCKSNLATKNHEANSQSVYFLVPLPLFL